MLTTSIHLIATYSFDAPRDTVFAALIDPSFIQRCIDVCEKMLKTGNDSYDAHLKIVAGGLKGSYVAKMLVKEKKPPESFTLVMDSKGGPGFVKGTVKIRLTTPNNKTELDCDADVQIGGLVAAVGSRRVELAAKKMLDEFFWKFTEQFS